MSSNTTKELERIENTLKFVLRKNKFYYNEGEFVLGKATEVLEIGNSFSDMKSRYLQELQKDIVQMAGNGMYASGTKFKQRYNYFLFRKAVKGNSQLSLENYQDDLIDFFYNSMTNGWKFSSAEETEIFDYFYPIRSCEIVVTNESFLLAPRWNKKHFDSIRQELPSSQLIFNYDQILSDWHVTKGLYVDELDFWINMLQDSNGFGYLMSFYNHDLESLGIMDKEIDWSSKGLRIENSKMIPKDRTNPIPYYWMNKLCAEPPLVFEKVPIDDCFSYQMESYKELIFAWYLEMRFLPAFHYEHEEIMTQANLSRWFECFLSEKIAKSVIEKYKDELMAISEERLKGYQS